MKCASGEAGLEILVGKLADLLEFVGFRVPQPDGRQGHAVECIGLYHRIMGLVEEGDPPSRSRAAGDSIVADDVPCQAGRATESGELAFHFLMQHGGADRKSTRLNSSHSCASRMPF